MARTSKMDVHFSSDSSNWETPSGIFKKLHREFRFTLDACATPKNTKCKKFITAQEDCFAQNWAERSRGGAVFMNPPYGHGIYKFIEYALRQADDHGIVVVCLLPSRTDTAYFHDLCAHGEVRLLKGRLVFEENGLPRRDDKGRPTPAPFPCQVTIFGGPRGAEILAWDP